MISEWIDFYYNVYSAYTVWLKNSIADASSLKDIGGA